MPRPRSSNPRIHQLLLRLTADEWDVLTALAHLNEAKSANDFAYLMLQRRLKQASNDPLVQADIANRRAFSARATEDVIPLHGDVLSLD